MMIFSEDTEIVRSIPAMIASYLASLLEAGKLHVWPAPLFPRLGL